MPTLSQGILRTGSTIVAGNIVQPSPSLLPVTVSVTTGGTAHTAGTAVEVSSSLPAACSWLEVQVASGNGSAATDTSTLIEVRTGASLSTVLLTCAGGYRAPQQEGTIAAWAGPVPIPAGTRLGVAARSARTGWSFSVAVGTYTTVAPVSAPVPFGVDTATSKSSIVLPDPAGTGTPGAWTQITASTSEVWQGVHLGPQMNANTIVSSGLVDIEIGVGASSSEQVVGAMRLNYNAAERLGVLTRPFVPALIPAGSRVVARVASRSGATQPVDLLVHGIPLGG